MKLVLKPGEQIKVTLAGTDGEFVIHYGKNNLTVTADLPDDSGRVNTIYEELHGKHTPFPYGWDYTS